MNVKQVKTNVENITTIAPDQQSHLVLVFGERMEIEKGIGQALADLYPNAQVVLCSTAGEIMNNNVYDGSICITSVSFEKTTIKSAIINMKDYANSAYAGESIVKELQGDKLKHILVFADGQMVNGSDLVKGMNTVLPSGGSISGGLAGDAGRFEKTLVGLNSNVQTGNIVAIGLYGDHLQVSCGSRGGWDSFGPDRKITKADANVLYELDGKSALSLYKKYLGGLADQLPGSALLFPLSIRMTEQAQPLVRTILSINEDDQSMTFAGNMPVGAYARLMKANFDRLIDAAAGAAETCLTPLNAAKPELAILVSCVGRKIVLGQRIDEEIEGVRSEFGDATVLSGFYSYGEISPLDQGVGCELYNQTMTITAFRGI
jgi:hypothetical protein